MSDAEFPILVVIENDQQHAKPASLRAISAARQLGDSYSLLCLGRGIETVVAGVSDLGAARIYVADHEALADPLADRYAKVVVDVAAQDGSRTILAAGSTFSRDLLPRVAALIDAPMLSDVTHIESTPDQTIYQRPVNAGSEVATVTLESPRRVLTIRAGAFELPQRTDERSPRQSVAVSRDALPNGMQFVSREQRQSQRPELSEARVVVAGGRPIKDREAFEQLVGRLADTLGGAVGATRALVDAGVVPNDWQIGQTGKVLSPELYIGIGISGAVQHLAGIMDARVIVAINKDPTAPIMKMASYALTGDLFELVPQLIQALQRGDEPGR
ncbi:MAG: electron transfer flavoprotein subunit alpha/FixB family protein [Pirellulales bacterium]